MAGHRYISNSNNLFDDDDVDDDTFVNSYRSQMASTQPTRVPAYGGQLGVLERQRQAMLERQREIEQRTLDSSARSLGLLRESETIGIETAKELVDQREKLEATNRRLDEMNTNLNQSQKHLNGIKSVFYGLKNYIAGKSDQGSSRSQASPETQSMGGPSSSRLDGAIANLSVQTSNISAEERFSSHPSARLRGLEQQTVAPISESQRVNEMLDANLDEMVTAIQRLKGLGVELGQEIDVHNELIDTIQDKVEGADLKIGKQNKQMNKLLGKS